MFVIVLLIGNILFLFLLLANKVPLLWDSIGLRDNLVEIESKHHICEGSHIEHDYACSHFTVEFMKTLQAVLIATSD